MTIQLKNCAFRNRIEFPTEPPGGLPFSTTAISRTVEQQYLQQIFQELKRSVTTIRNTIFDTNFKSAKMTITFVMPLLLSFPLSVCLFVCLCVCPFGTTLSPLDSLSYILIFAYFSKIGPEHYILSKIGQVRRLLHMKTKIYF